MDALRDFKQMKCFNNGLYGCFFSFGSAWARAWLFVDVLWSWVDVIEIKMELQKLSLEWTFEVAILQAVL